MALLIFLEYSNSASRQSLAEYNPFEGDCPPLSMNISAAKIVIPFRMAKPFSRNQRGQIGFLISKG